MQAAAIIGRMARSRFFGLYGPVYSLEKSEVHKRQTAPAPDCRVSSYDRWCDIDAPIREALSHHGDQIWWDTEQLLSNGGQMWIGSVSGEPASLGWSWPGDKVRAYFFPLTSSCVLLSHFVTFPAFRGRGLYVALLVHIVQALTARGAERFFIHCADWNTASLHGIERVGFRRIGFGIARRNKHLVWYPRSRA